jgi:hypothetical protein
MKKLIAVVVGAALALASVSVVAGKSEAPADFQGKNVSKTTAMGGTPHGTLSPDRQAPEDRN